MADPLIPSLLVREWSDFALCPDSSMEAFRFPHHHRMNLMTKDEQGHHLPPNQIFNMRLLGELSAALGLSFTSEGTRYSVGWTAPGDPNAPAPAPAALFIFSSSALVGADEPVPSIPWGNAGTNREIHIGSIMHLGFLRMLVRAFWPRQSHNPLYLYG